MRTRSVIGWTLGLAMLLAARSGAAQPADLPIPAASTQTFPAGIHIASAGGGLVYADATGRVLYGLDMRVLQRLSPDPAMFCTGTCAEQWEPILAPTGAQPNIAYPPGYRGRGRPGETPQKRGFVTQASAPDWTVIAGPQGPQWVYKGWHLVFAHRGDKPGTIAHEGADNLAWNTLKYIPLMPSVSAPGGVHAALVGTGYVLADKDGHALFIGRCAKDCTAWQPLAAGMASAPVGGWAVSRRGDVPQWTLDGAPVFVSQDDDPTRVPAGTKVLRP